MIYFTENNNMKFINCMLFTMLVVGCAPSTYQLEKKIFLPNTVSELTDELGSPKSTQSLPGQKQGQLLNFSTGTYQIEQDLVKAFLKPASGNESKLQYWLQKWQGQAYSKADLETLHGTPKTIVYKNSAEKVSLIYSVANDEVQKVIYEK